MQEINAAWAVLGDPAARARYDDQLPAPRPPVVPRAPAGSRPRPTAAPPISPDPADDPDRGPDGDRDDGPKVVTVATEIRAPRWLVWTPVVIGLIVIGVLAVGLVLGSRTSPSGGSVGTVGSDPAGFAVGDCVALVTDPAKGPTAAPLVVAVVCTDEHTGRIVSRPTTSADCPRDTKTVVVPGDPRALCLG